MCQHQLSALVAPARVDDYRNAVVSVHGYLRVTYVLDTGDTVGKRGKCGTALVQCVVQYVNAYTRCDNRGPVGVLIGLFGSSNKRPDARDTPLLGYSAFFGTAFTPGRNRARKSCTGQHGIPSISSFVVPR